MRLEASSTKVVLADAGSVGLVFGSTSARGRGVFASRPARFELLSFAFD